MKKDHIRISSPALRVLLETWKNEEDVDKKQFLKDRLREVLREIERDSFFVRFQMKDFDSWYQVLSEEEADSHLAKKQDFFREPLIKLLDKHPKGIEPLKARLAVRT